LKLLEEARIKDKGLSGETEKELQKLTAFLMTWSNERESSKTIKHAARRFRGQPPILGTFYRRTRGRRFVQGDGQSGGVSGPLRRSQKRSTCAIQSPPITGGC